MSPQPRNTARAGRRGATPTPADLRQSVAAGNRSPFYLLHGDEDYARASAYAWLVERLAPEAPDFNIDVVQGEGFDAQRFLDLYQAYPMMASHRLVVIKACDKLTAEQCRSVEQVASAPADTTILIAVGGRVDLRRKLWQQLSKAGLAIEFRILYENEVPRWIDEHAKSRHLRLEPGVADLLRLYVGNNLRELATELEKLATHAGDGQEITRAAVEDLVGASRSTSIFEFTDAVGQLRYARAQELLHELLDQGEEPLRILPMISRHLQLLLKAQHLTASGVPNGEMAKRLGVSPYFLGSYRKQAATLDRGALWDGLETLVRTDRNLKSLGRKQQRNVMDLCLSELAGDLRPARG